MYHGERLNSVTHLLGLALAVVGSAVLVAQAVHSGDLLKILSFSVFGLTMIVLYAASSLYHSIRGASKALWAKVDHCAIYLLIAGTYTPFCALVVGGWRGGALLVAVWLVATAGILLKVLHRHRPEAVTVVLYVALGWIGIVQLDTVIERMSPTALALLLGGGVIYTAGVPVHLRDSLPYAQAIWHGFVFAAAACHYAAIVLALAAA